MRSSESRRTVTDSGRVITRRIVKALTDMRTVDSVAAWRTGVFTEWSYPARQTVTLPGHQVAVGVVLTLTRLITVGAVLSLIAFCQHSPSTLQLSLTHNNSKKTCNVAIENGGQVLGGRVWRMVGTVQRNRWDFERQVRVSLISSPSRAKLFHIIVAKWQKDRLPNSAETCRRAELIAWTYRTTNV